MGLFDKKYCDVCGEKIGLLGNRKLEDGNLCKNCAKKLSPWFDERRHSTVAQIKEQLAYREANKDAVAKFNVTRSFGDRYRLLIDEDAQVFAVSSSDNMEIDNADVIRLDQVTGCDLDVDERRYEEMRTDKDGKEVSYNPPHYRYEYDFNIVIRVNSPWFDEIRFPLNRQTVEVFPPTSRGGLFITSTDSPGRRSYEYKQYEDMGHEIKDALLNARRQAREETAGQKPVQQEAPRTDGTVVCPLCGAKTKPDAKGKCEYCGGTIIK